jgi:hypothetical protein
MTLTEKILRSIAWLSLPAIALAAGSYNYFAPGGALSCSGACTQQSVDLGSGSFIINTLPVPHGGTGTTTSTGTGNTVLSNSPAFISPNLGTPSVLDLANATDLQLSAFPPIDAYTTLANVTGSTAIPQKVNPLALGNLMEATFGVDLATTANTTLSGTQTVDGIFSGNGLVVLVTQNTGNITDGFYITNSSGAWTRAPNFPAGYVINQGCVVLVKVRIGTVNGGNTFFLNTASPITIATTAQNWQSVNEQGSSSKFGKVKVPANNATVPSVNTIGINAFDCANWQDTVGTIADTGNALNGVQGGCALENTTSGGLILDGSPPTSSAGTIDPNSVQNRGRVTGLTAVATVTITFAVTFGYVPSCFGSNSAGTAVGVSAASATAVTFTMVALTGTLYYTCF